MPPFDQGSRDWRGDGGRFVRDVLIIKSAVEFGKAEHHNGPD